jgi:hypothetical protein
MSSTPVPVTPSAARDRARPAWLYAVPMWAGLAIVSIWVAVLFVGLFAGDIVSINGTPGAGTTTTVPSVVVVALFALIATVSLGRWGFGSRRAERKEDGAS